MKEISGFRSTGEIEHSRVLRFRPDPVENSDSYCQDYESAQSSDSSPSVDFSNGNTALLFPFLILGQSLPAEVWQNESNPRKARDLTDREPPESGAASCLSDLISSAQLRLARRLGRHAGVDADKEAERLFGLRLSELSRHGAETVIERLQMLATAGRGSVRQAV